MITDLQSAQLCGASYDPQAVWDRVLPETENLPVHILIKRLGSQWCVVMRGSDTLEDWYDNLEAIPYEHSLLGVVMRGFFLGLEERFMDVYNMVGENPCFCGHSRGAAQAVLMAALFAARHIPVAGVIGFGCPRTGYSKHADILKAIPGRLYHNAGDPVCDVPLPALGFPWQHAWAENPIKVLGTFDGPFMNHHVSLYERGVTP